MIKDKIFKRAIEPKFEKAIKCSPVVLLIGARQTGKTTLVKEFGAQNGYQYITFDDIRFTSAATHDPIGFIEQLKKPIILDEVQRVPELFLTIKKDVDENRTSGNYILTGSAHPLVVPRLGDSLAGRMEILPLFPLSQGEMINAPETFIDTIFGGKVPKARSIAPKDMYKKIDIGGYPTIQFSEDFATRESWFDSYVTTLLQRDVKDLANISGLTQLPNLLTLLAARASCLLNNAELARTSGTSSTTLHRYLALFQALFLIHFQPAWSTNVGKRLVKAPKVYFVDTGLLSFLLGIHLEQTLSVGRMVGALVENFVVGELHKQISWSTARVKLFHFRTTSGIEVDIVLENAAGKIIGIEVKSSQTVTAQDFKGLTYLSEIAGDKFVQGFVLYMGAQHVPFGAKLHALPIASLWT